MIMKRHCFVKHPANFSIIGSYQHTFSFSLSLSFSLYISLSVIIISTSHSHKTNQSLKPFSVYLLFSQTGFVLVWRKLTSNVWWKTYILTGNVQNVLMMDYHRLLNLNLETKSTLHLNGIRWLMITRLVLIHHIALDQFFFLFSSRFSCLCHFVFEL